MSVPNSLIILPPHPCNHNYVFGESDGTPLQYSCLENPMDGGAWWAAVHGVAESQMSVVLKIPGEYSFEKTLKTTRLFNSEKVMAAHSSTLAWRIP